MLYSDFGLHAVISHVNIPTQLDNVMDPFARYRIEGMSTATTTLAFMSLPFACARQSLDDEDTRNYDDAWREAYISMSHVVTPAKLKLKLEQSNRFSRVMRVLGLKPFVHFVQILSLGEALFPTTPCNSLSCLTGLRSMTREDKDELRDNIKKIIHGMLEKDQVRIWMQQLTLQQNFSAVIGLNQWYSPHHELNVIVFELTKQNKNLHSSTF